MVVLALDTTTRPGSVALVDDTAIIEERPGDPSRTHAESLPGALLALLGAHGLSPGSVDLFAVACGPGSFTGLRIGIATVQGLALVGGRPIVAVSALEALGQIGSIGAGPEARVAVWMDAHRRDVFAALFRVTAAALFEPERLEAIDGPLVGSPASILARWSEQYRGSSVTWIGDGAAAFAGTIAATIEAPVLQPHRLLAGAIGQMAIVRARRGGAVHPAAVQPLYVRRPDAEIDRDRRGCTALETDTKG